MSKQSKKGLIGLIAGLALAALMLLGMHGCSGRESAQTGATVCPPGATFCPAPVAEGGAFGVPEPAGAVLGTLAAPVRNAKVMVCDDKQSDPRVIVMDVPAGTVLMKEAGDR